MYRAHLVGGPLDGSVFRVPVVHELMTAARYDDGPYVIVDPLTCEPVQAQYQYRRVDPPQGKTYTYIYAPMS